MIKWKWQQIIFWLVAEMFLNFVGYDNLADYSEYIMSQSPTAAIAVRKV
jgi:hypothetical protein